MTPVTASTVEAMLRALLLAPPGAGKGTQGERLADIYGVPHLATGDELRRQVREGTPLGQEAAGYMQRGELVPDTLVTEMVARILTQPTRLEGFILDGFPRTIGQARAAYQYGQSQGVTFHAVVSIDVPEDELVRRVLERGRATGRADDTPETIRTRLRVYHDQTAPLLEFYDGRGILVEVDGTGSVEEVTYRIREQVDKRYPDGGDRT